MPKNEDGEFELILGNRQMMSVFFIVVLLFGVIFAIGYILGRNSGPATEVATTAHKSEKAVVVPSPAQSGSPAASADAPAPEPPKQEEKKAEPEKKAEALKPEPPKAEVKKAEAPKPEPKKEAKVEKPAKAAAPAATGQPAPGTYLQLAATKREEAELEVDVLRKKGFKAMAAQHPENPILFRVLVGPLAKNDINKMKTDLKNAGFPGDHAIPKTF